MVGGSVGVIDLRRQRENGEKTQIRRINADSDDSFPDSGEISLRSGKNLIGFDEISPDPVKISLDLREISSESGFLRRILENYRRILEIFAGIWKSFGRFGFLRRKTETDPPESVSDGEDPPPEQSGRSDSSRVRPILQVGRVAGSIWTALILVGMALKL